MKIPVYIWELEQSNPLTPAEKRNVKAEADVHRRIPGTYYKGMAEGMDDIAKEYGRNPLLKKDFYYWIDLDERGEFRATVYNSSGKVVFEIDGFDIFEDGFMRHKKDVQGLEEYLKTLGIIPPSGRLFYESPKLNPVVPFRRRAISSGSSRTDPDALLRTRLWAAAQSVTNDAQKAGMLVDAFYQIISRNLPKAVKGKLIPFQGNPGQMTKIYSRIIEIRASKEGMRHRCDAKCRAAGHCFKHPFSKKACVYGLADGRLLIG